MGYGNIYSIILEYDQWQGDAKYHRNNSTPFGRSFEPLSFFACAGFYIFQSPYFLLIIQTLVLAFGALPIYLLSERILQKRNFSVIIALGYLISPSLHWLNLFDFHEVAFFVPLFLFGFYFFIIKRYFTAIIFLALSTGVIENAILAVFIFGIYAFISGVLEKDKKMQYIGIGVSVISLLYFIIGAKYIMPSFGGGLIHLDRYSKFGSSFGEIIKNIIMQPKLSFETIFQFDKFMYMLWIFLPVFFLPLFVKESVLLIPGLAQNLFTNYEFQFSNIYHYDALLIPALWIATIFGIKFFLKKRQTLESHLWKILCVSIFIGFLFRSPLNPWSFPHQLFKNSNTWQRYREMVALVPTRASISAHTNLVPHIALREHVYMLGREPFMVDIVLADLSDSFGFASKEAFYKYLETYMQSSQYTVKIFDERYLVIYRKEITIGILL